VAISPHVARLRGFVGDEVSATGWFRRDELAGLALNPFARAPLSAVGYLEKT
jgi:hypothetical protein